MRTGRQGRLWFDRVENPTFEPEIGAGEGWREQGAPSAVRVSKNQKTASTFNLSNKEWGIFEAVFSSCKVQSVNKNWEVTWLGSG